MFALTSPLKFTTRVLALGIGLLAMGALAGVSTAQADITDFGTSPSLVTQIGSSGGGGASPTTYDILNSNAALTWGGAGGSEQTQLKTDETKAQTAATEEAASSTVLAAGDALWGNLAINNSSSNSTWGYRVHGLPGLTGDGAIIGFNIKIWRQGQSQPLLERSVCTSSPTGSAPPYPGSDGVNWVAGSNGTTTSPLTGAPASNYNSLLENCGGSLPLSVNGEKGGFLSTESNSEKAACESNRVNGSNHAGQGVIVTAKPSSEPTEYFCYWQGSELGAYADLSPFSTFNSKTHSMSGGQLHEAVYLHWTISGKSLQLGYAIDGPPNTLYAVQITAVNWKDQLMPVYTAGCLVNSYDIKPCPFTYGSAAAVAAGSAAHVKTVDGLPAPQYFRVFVPNATPPHITPHCDASTGYVWTPLGSSDPTTGATTCPPSHPHCDASTGYRWVPSGSGPGGATTCSKPAPHCDASTGYVWMPIGSRGPGGATTCANGGGAAPSTSPWGPAPTSVLLTAPTVAQTRETIMPTVELSVAGVLAAQQAVFPVLTTLRHETPQSAFDGSQSGPDCINAYQPNFVLYGQSNLTGDQVQPVLAPEPPAARNVCQTILSQAPVLTTLSRDVGALSTNLFSMTWLKGTISNPCTTSQPNFGDPNTTATWPSVGNVCTPDGSKPSTDPTTVSATEQKTLNIWDDYLGAVVTWESRWVSAYQVTCADGSTPTNDLCADGSAPVPAPSYGYITGSGQANQPDGQLLRCDSQGVFLNATYPDAINSTNNEATSTCPQPFFPLSSVVAGNTSSTQYAQGYLFANGTDSVKHPADSATADVQVILDTNAAAYMTQAAMWDRTSGTVVGNSITQTANVAGFSNALQPVLNTRSPRSSAAAELNFCEQGVQAGLGVYQHQYHPTQDGATTSAGAGDPNCNGYAVHWEFADPTNASTPTSACEVSTPEAANPPAASTYPVPTALQLNPNNGTVNTAASAIVAGWGVYGQEYSGSQVAYAADLASWKTDPNAAALESLTGNTAQTPKTPPYIGERPGTDTNGSAVTVGASRHCSAVVSGYWNVGHWVKSWKFADTAACQFKTVSKVYQPAADTSIGGYPGPGGVLTDAIKASITSGGPTPPSAPAASPNQCGSPPSVQYDYKLDASKNTIVTPADPNNRAASCPADEPYPESPSNPDNYSSNGDNCHFWPAVYHPATTRPKKKAYTTPAYMAVRGFDVVPSSTPGVGGPYSSQTYYSFGYWYYVWNWVWGPTPAESATAAGRETAAYECVPAQTTPANENDTHYAGPLQSSNSYGISKFVYDYAGTTPNPAQPGNGTAYSGANQNLWQGVTYPDSPTGPASPGTASGTYGSTTASTGANSQRCTVIRNHGWVTTGAWVVGNYNPSDETNQKNDPSTGIPLAPLATPSQPVGSFTDSSGTHSEIFADTGWGANNTGPRVPNGEYNVQFTFGGLDPASLATASSYCTVHMSPTPNAVPAQAVTVTGDPVPGYCWAMAASYDGETDYVWSHQMTDNITSPGSTGVASQTVSVFAPRNTR